MNEHVHTGFAAFLFAGVSALIFLNLVRLGAAYAVKSETPAISSAGKTVGALVHFG